MISFPFTNTPVVVAVPKRLIVLILILGSVVPSRSTCANDKTPLDETLEGITVSSLKRHCSTLASDALEGREAGSNGGKAACAYLQSELRQISGLEPAGTSSWTQEFLPDYRNVIAALPGADPDLKKEFILIGAHYDHVGRGNSSNSRGPIGYIHNGADDNASGTAALLELAKAFTSLPQRPRRAILFAFWDAEEIGLLGSKHWVRNPTRPLKQLKLVLNIDMLGRLRDGNLIVMGWRSATSLRSRLTSANEGGHLGFEFTPTVIADSDHYPFYESRIPSIHFDSGKHEDYHRPTDDADKLNYDGIRTISAMVFRLAFTAANDSELPGFRPDAFNEPSPRWMSKQPPEVPPMRFGVAFDPESFQKDIAIVSQVVPGSPAERAGVRRGDRILQFAHWNGKRTNDLRTIIQTTKSPTQVRIEREGKNDPIDLQVTLLGEAVRVGISWQIDPAMPGCAAITRVVPESPADRAGLMAGDVVISLGENPVSSEAEFRRQLLQNSSPIVMTVDRAGRTKSVEIDLLEP